jgi:acetylornithine deacetylase
MEELYKQALELLQNMIATPSLSTEEGKVADRIQHFIEGQSHKINRKGNNIWVVSPAYSTNKPTILLNSHVDTVKPSMSWSYDPYRPTIVDGKLFGLGSNDAGASVVTMLMAFLHLSQSPQPYNLIYAATAEEESSGPNGIESIVDEFGKIDLAIFGEPTRMQMAVAERGLMVLDCTAHGKAGHAARNEGDNAIYKSLRDIEWFRTFRFPEESKLLGTVKMTVTQINAGYQHNVVPDKCSFVVDVRTNEYYQNKDVFEIIRNNVFCDVEPRSMRLNSSIISLDHPIVLRGIEQGINYYGSPTTSDQAVTHYTSLKMGPGDSARSHTADEFIYLKELKEGIEIYIKLLDNLALV